MSTALVIGGLALLAAGALVPVLLQARRQGARGAAARARSAHARLGHVLETAGGVDPVVHRRGYERWTAAGAVLAQARSAPEFALAERTADEGLALLAAPAPAPPRDTPRGATPRSGRRRRRNRRR